MGKSTDGTRAQKDQASYGHPPSPQSHERPDPAQSPDRTYKRKAPAILKRFPRTGPNARIVDANRPGATPSSPEITPKRLNERPARPTPGSLGERLDTTRAPHERASATKTTPEPPAPGAETRPPEPYRTARQAHATRRIRRSRAL